MNKDNDTYQAILVFMSLLLSSIVVFEDISNTVITTVKIDERKQVTLVITSFDVVGLFAIKFILIPSVINDKNCMVSKLMKMDLCKLLIIAIYIINHICKDVDIDTYNNEGNICCYIYAYKFL